jgi:hypothetical protein
MRRRVLTRRTAIGGGRGQRLRHTLAVLGDAARLGSGVRVAARHPKRDLGGLAPVGSGECVFRCGEWTEVGV